MRNTFLKVCLVVLLFFGAFAVVAKSIPSAPSLPPEEAPFDVAAIKTKQDIAMAGQKIFFGKGQCALCHSIEPSASSRCQPLRGIGEKLTRDALYESLTNPEAFIYLDYSSDPPKPFSARMPQVTKPPIGLTENELLAVVAFLQTLGGEITMDPSELTRLTKVAASRRAGRP